LTKVLQSSRILFAHNEILSDIVDELMMINSLLSKNGWRLLENDMDGIKQIGAENPITTAEQTYHTDYGWGGN